MIIFTDGSYISKLHKGGIGVFVGKDSPQNISEPLLCHKITNQVAELTALSKALDILKEKKDEIHYIYTDSKYIIGTFTEWIKTWEKNNWKRKTGKIENLDLIKEIYNKLSSLHVIFKHVKSHQKEPPKDDPRYEIWYGNKEADYLATQGSKASV